MSKLTKEQKKTIVEAALTANFSDVEKTYKASRTALADAIYETEYGAAEAIAKKLPSGWCRNDRHLRIVCTGFGYGKSSESSSSNFETSKDRFWPQGYAATEITLSHPQYVQAQEVLRQHAAIYKARQELESKLYALVASCGTLKQLHAAWPLGAEFFPEEKVTGTALVPINLVPEINKIMGLPQKGKKVQK
jgi:hypothetical protein